MLIRRLMVTSFILIAGVILCASFAITSAQPVSIQPGFATNTAHAEQQSPLFATNTPQPDPAMYLPSAPYERYALRLWYESELTAILLSEVQELIPGDTEREMAIRLLQDELARRFPGAPHDPAIRAELIQVMLDAPRGRVDMRATIRPYIAAALNEIRPMLNEMSSFDYKGFNITIMTADIDGDVIPDAVIRTRYPALVNDPADLRYQDYVIAQVDTGGDYIIRDATSMLPAAPLFDVQSINLERLSDTNQDRLDELVLSINSGDVNQELLIFGWRNGAVINLIQPGSNMLFGEIANFPINGESVTVTEHRVESAAWGCLGERDVPWTWTFNYFRPSVSLDDFTFQNRLACHLYASEPIFEQPVAEAMSTIESLVSLAQPEDEAPAQRAAVTLAMLRVLNGDIAEALEQVTGLQASAEPGSWLEEQTSAFLEMAAESNVTPVQLCAALQEASTYGACDVQQVLTRLFAEEPLNRDEPIEIQLGRLGITVLDETTITQIGKLNRQAVHFRLAGDHWWAFAPLASDTYTAEMIEPLPGYEVVIPPAPIITPPITAFNALLVQSNLAETLNILDNAVRDNPNGQLASSGRFMRALCYDLLGDRANARPAYFRLWTDDPLSVWGQLAAAHLELR